jgi:hypothetical protein
MPDGKSDGTAIPHDYEGRRQTDHATGVQEASVSTHRRRRMATLHR